MLTKSVASLTHFEALDAVTLEMPRWVRKGLVLRLIALIAVIFIIPLFIPWRATLELPLTILTSEPPRSVRVESDGPLTNLLVKPGDRVSYGDILGRTGSLSDHRDIDRLSRELQALINSATTVPTGTKLPPVSVGGEVQDAHSVLAAAIDKMLNFQTFGSAQSELVALSSELAVSRRELPLELEQHALIVQAVELADEKLKRHENGAKQGWVSKNALGLVRSELVDRKLAAQQSRQRLTQRTARFEQLSARIEEQRLLETGSSDQMRNNVRQAAIRLSGAISAWRRAHEFVAPIDGLVKFPEQVRVAQYFNAGNEIAVVVPETNGVIAVGLASDQGNGEITSGAQVIISVPGFPTSSYGHLEGLVTHTSDVSVDGGYELVVSLQNGLRTSSGVKLPVRNRSRVNASVVVRRTTLGNAIVSDFFERWNFR
jgi:hypothetical protein